MNNPFKNKEFQLDELLFENRNKQYGAYVLRQDSDRILTKALFFGIAFIGVLALTPLVILNLKSTDQIPKFPIPDGGHILTPVDQVDPPIKDIENPPQTSLPTFDSTVPIPKAHIKDVEKPAANVNQYNDAKPGTNDNVSDTPANVPYVPPIVGTGTLPKTNPTPTVPEKKDDEIKEKVDVVAKFEGGLDAFRKKVGQKFDTTEFEGSGEYLTTTVTFVVEKDGSISNVKAFGTDRDFNKEAEKTIRSIKEAWKPALLKGEVVRSNFKIPISMKFE